jgi:type IV pilus assembly protein PilB
VGAEPFLVSSSVTLVLAQRLVRKICSKCKQTYQPVDFILEKLGLASEEFKDMVFYKGFGCPFCSQTGYAGRIAVFETMSVTPQIAEMIDRKATSSEIKKEARVEGMLTLREDAISKMKKGITSAEEVLRETSETG